MKENLKILGVTATLDFLNKTVKNINNEMNKGVTDATHFLQGEIVKSISGQRVEHRSVDTGRLKQSISSKINFGEGQVFTNVKYAPFIEYGTSKFKARAHFRNSVERNRNIINEMIASKITSVNVNASFTGVDLSRYND